MGATEAAKLKATLDRGRVMVEVLDLRVHLNHSV